MPAHFIKNTLNVLESLDRFKGQKLNRSARRWRGGAIYNAVVKDLKTIHLEQVDERIREQNKLLD